MKKQYSLIFQDKNKSIQQKQYENRRARTLYKAIQKYKILKEDLAIKLFELTKTGKKRKVSNNIQQNQNQLIMNHNKNHSTGNIRKNRRQILGIDEADIQNHMNKTFGKPLLAKRRICQPPKSDYPNLIVKKKNTIKGFAASISHTLGKKKSSMITQVINTDLLST